MNCEYCVQPSDTSSVQLISFRLYTENRENSLKENLDLTLNFELIVEFNSLEFGGKIREIFIVLRNSTWTGHKIANRTLKVL